jgi:hypothetical protein
MILFEWLCLLLEVSGYAMLAITIYCCCEAYFKIKRNKGYIYIAIVCVFLLLPRITSLLYSAPPNMQTISDRPDSSKTSIRPLVIHKSRSIHLPFVELFLLLAVLRFAIKEEKDNPNQEATGNPASPDTRA